jgi:periplasmic protein TonB
VTTFFCPGRRYFDEKPRDFLSPHARAARRPGVASGPRGPCERDNCPAGETRRLVIKAKPNPGYTLEARRNGVEGRVVLRVEFRAGGQIGDITPLEELPDGLTEKAVEAAKLIEFEPELRDGQPVTRTLRVMFQFRLH